jgi:hypothetical protein
MYFGFINVITLFGYYYRHVSATHVAKFRMVSAQKKIFIVSR